MSVPCRPYCPAYRQLRSHIIPQALRGSLCGEPNLTCRARCGASPATCLTAMPVSMWLSYHRNKAPPHAPTPHLAPLYRRRYRTFKDEHRLYMLMDYVAGGELFRHLRAAGCGACATAHCQPPMTHVSNSLNVLASYRASIKAPANRSQEVPHQDQLLLTFQGPITPHQKLRWVET